MLKPAAQRQGLRERHIRLNYLGTFFVDVAPDYVALIGSTYILFVNAPSLGLFKQKVYKVTKVSSKYLG